MAACLMPYVAFADSSEGDVEGREIGVASAVDVGSLATPPLEEGKIYHSEVTDFIDGVETVRVMDEGDNVLLYQVHLPAKIEPDSRINSHVKGLVPNHSYDIEINTSEGVILELPVESASAGCAVVATLRDGSVSTVAKSAPYDGGIVFSMPPDVESVRVVERAARLDDMDGAQWFEADGTADWAISHGIVSGVDLGGRLEFRGNDATSRAMFATMLHRLEGTPAVSPRAPFGDIGGEYVWCEDAVSWAVKMGIAEGYSPTSFMPGKPIAREEAALMLKRYADALGLDTGDRADLSAFDDSDELGAGRDAMSWAVSKGLFRGNGNMLRPLDGATRAETCTVFMRFVDLLLQ